MEQGIYLKDRISDGMKGQKEERVPTDNTCEK